MTITPNTIFANRYRLIRKIGSGGFADVWQAADQMAEDMVVAVKIYVPDRGMDDRGIKQFRREYAGVMNLNHPNLLTARHFDIWEGRPYLIMPYISGGSLADRLMDEGTFDEAGIAKVLQDVGSGLDYLHRKEVLHQDIKPDNILIGDEGQYLLTDFGISGRLRATLRKQTGSQVSLTIAYAPPERFDATPRSLPASDVFSLGVLAYELATGDVPWMGMGGISLKQGADVPEIGNDFSASLINLLTRLMALRPEERPQPAEIAEQAGRYLTERNWQAKVQVRQTRLLQDVRTAVPEPEGQRFTIRKAEPKTDGKLVDIDGNRYRTVQIGEQLWMAENLNVSRFRNGDPIPEIRNNKAWIEAGKNKQPAWCYYDNDPENGDRFGKLYNWYAVVNPRGIGPEGWQIPTDLDWLQLEELMSNNGLQTSVAKIVSSQNTRDKLKYKEMYWGSEKRPSTIILEAIPVGFRGADHAVFSNKDNQSFWWGVFHSSHYLSSFQVLSTGNGRVFTYDVNKNYGFSIRCLKSRNSN